MNAIAKMLASCCGNLLVGLGLADGFGGYLQLSLDNQSSCANNSGSIVNYEEIITALSLCVHPVVSFVPLCFSDVTNSCKDTQTVEETTVVVRLSHWADCI